MHATPLAKLFLPRLVAVVLAGVVTQACQRRVDEPKVHAESAHETAASVATPTLLPAPSFAPPLAPGPLAPAPLPTSLPTSLPTPGSPLIPAPSAGSAAAAEKSLSVRFAVIGDYGVADGNERRVADLVKSFRPDFVITTGDNNYPKGEAATIDANIGQFYAEFIAPYRGKHGPGASENRFFPSLGNHDWYADGASAYFEYFTLPGNERYYTFSRGPVDFFALDSDEHEPDGVTKTSKQAAWLKTTAKAARGAWQIAYMHHPPYSSGPHGSELNLQWPYREWGIDLVLAGHDHHYERVSMDGLTYLVNGLGGNHEYELKTPVPGSLFRYNSGHGAQLAEATDKELRITFVSVEGTRIDEVVLKHD